LDFEKYRDSRITRYLLPLLSWIHHHSPMAKLPHLITDAAVCDRWRALLSIKPLLTVDANRKHRLPPLPTPSLSNTTIFNPLQSEYSFPLPDISLRTLSSCNKCSDVTENRETPSPGEITLNLCPATSQRSFPFPVQVVKL
jgi:hypothetical protein